MASDASGFDRAALSFEPQIGSVELSSYNTVERNRSEHGYLIGLGNSSFLGRDNCPGVQITWLLPLCKESMDND